MKRILILFISIFTLTPTFAQKQAKIEKWFDQGLEFHEQGNYTEAVKWYRKAAEQGMAEAQYNLGVCYEYGEGVTKDADEAVTWYKKAADFIPIW